MRVNKLSMGSSNSCSGGLHNVNFGFEMVKVKHVSGKNIFYSTNKDKIGELGKEEFLKRYIVLLRAELKRTIYASRRGRSAGAS